MKKRWAIVIGIVLLVAMLARQFLFNSPAPFKHPEVIASAPLSPSIPEVKTNLLAYTFEPAEEYPEGSLYVHHSFADRLFGMVHPESLEKYEGSYSTHDLHHQNDNKSKSFGLNSSWVTGNSNLPEAGVHVAQNPVTGKYEVNGGEIFLPDPGVGVSYEKDEESGESKTFLNWKTTF